MNENTALGMLSRVMKWDAERSRTEFEWLRLISAVKYDNYRDFVAGARFLESLVGWLLQFEQIDGRRDDRDIAYDFVRHQLTFIGAVERERLVDLIYPRVALPRWLENVAVRRGIQPWQVNTLPEAKEELKVERRRTLFLGLSDGARLDSFRHVNVGRIDNEQVVAGTQLDSDKWKDLKEDLAKDLQLMGADAEATFKTIYLVDDFAGSGTSFIRTEHGDAGSDVWKGKLLRFLKSLKSSDKAYADDWTLAVHHLVMTQDAVDHLRRKLPEFKAAYEGDLPWFSRFDVTWNLKYDNTFKVSEESEFDVLTQKYYDQRIETPATNKGGVRHIGRGYAGCALPLVLDHNTPNNSVALLWAESEDADFEIPNRYTEPPHQMRPLFRRRQRHLK